MKEIELKPVEEKLAWSKEVGEMIDSAIFDTVYLPLLAILQDEVNERQNSKGDLLRALKTGRVSYLNGYFRGALSASISKTLKSLGATWDNREKAFKLSWASIPEDVKAAMNVGRNRNLDVRKRIGDKINELKFIPEKPLSLIDIGSHYEKIYLKLNDTFKKTLVPSLEVSADMTESVSNAIRDRYIENVDIYTSQWTREAIDRIHERVAEEVLAGFRADHLIDVIKAERGVSERKAKFIARQETSLMVSAFREARYKEAGIGRYKWGSSHDSRVRPRHRELSGHIFSWDSPPVVDEIHGRRAHPGEDFGCRCVAIPILRAKGEADESI